jgi:acetoin utilization deacetylase AcuC-like enzyme
MGFCLLNNVAIAAQDLLQQPQNGRPNAERLAIIDLDLHHGNGTQAVFYERKQVFYLSTHQSPHYPGTGELQETGSGGGAGTNANFPLLPFSGDRAFRTIMDELILPLLECFEPEMILVSYGFDTHWLDPLGNLRLSARMYGELILSLVNFADQHCSGRIALVLEGGYDLEAARACSMAVCAALLGEAYDDPLGACPSAEGESWRGMVGWAKELWGV